jgi:LAO/AO transport system kinase
MAEPIANWAERVRNGDVRALARAATWVENRRPEARDLLKLLFPHTGHALILGVTGPPGAGKSTLVNQLTATARTAGHTVGIVAVDPSSPFSGGAILGDRIRMQQHHADAGVFIRSTATRSWLGGLSRAATELALLLDAAGRDVVIVETVGVGQDEVEIARLADVTAVVLMPGMGDDVQALKAGILEVADLFVINKADRPGAEDLQRELEGMLALAENGGETPPILRTVASEGVGVAGVLAGAWARKAASNTGERHVLLWRHRLREMLRERLLEEIAAAEWDRAAAAVARRDEDPFTVVEQWLERLASSRHPANREGERSV